MIVGCSQISQSKINCDNLDIFRVDIILLQLRKNFIVTDTTILIGKKSMPLHKSSRFCFIYIYIFGTLSAIMKRECMQLAFPILYSSQSAFEVVSYFPCIASILPSVNNFFSLSISWPCHWRSLWLGHLNNRVSTNIYLFFSSHFHCLFLLINSVKPFVNVWPSFLRHVNSPGHWTVSIRLLVWSNC